MGGAVSSGRDNNELVDNLMSGKYIRTRTVERVFRALDRADYMSPEAREQAHKDLAWRNGPLHLSAPCIYSEVMEALQLKPGLSFLNIGSGTGYLSTMVGFIIGSSGISHGVEASAAVYEYANTKLAHFTEHCATLDEFDFCYPKFFVGNGLCLSPEHKYDRVYCGAGVITKYENYFKQFVKVGGVLVMPLADQLVQLRRVSEDQWSRRNLLNVSFAHLSEPTPTDRDRLLQLDEQSPAALQVLARAAVRGALRAALERRQPELREPAPPPLQPRQGPRRICIPYEPPSEEELSELHDLDEAEGAHEMNALLSLVLSMGQNRAAGSLRFHHDDRADLLEEEDEPASGEEAPAAEGAEDAAASEQESPERLAASARDDGYIVLDVGMRAPSRRWRRPPAPPARAPRPPHRPPHRPRACWTDASSSEDDAAQSKDNKRQKLDSGIGEGASSGGSPSGGSPSGGSPSGGSPAGGSPDTEDDKRSARGEDEGSGSGDMQWAESEGESAISDSDSDSGSADTLPARPPAHGRRREVRWVRTARARRSRAASDSGAECGASCACAGAAPEHPRDVRRARLSRAMCRAVTALPLPHALKAYVNYGRPYQL